MRVYVTKPLSFGEGPDKRDCPASGFYNVPDDVGSAWVACGDAYGATDDNKVRAWDGDLQVIVDLDSGVTSLEDLTPNKPEPAPDPVPDSQPLPEPDPVAEPDPDPEIVE